MNEKKKILLLSLTPCYPLFSGGALAQYYFIDGLKERVQFVFCTVVRTEQERKDLEQLKKQQPALEVYYHDAIPHKSKKSFARKIKSLLVSFSLFFTKKRLSNVHIDLNADDFSDSYFWNVDHKFLPDFVALVNSVIEKEKIEIVQFDFYDTIDFCFALPSHVKKIFIHHEVRYKRLRLAASMSTQPQQYKDYLINKTEKFEKLCLQQMDHVVVFNEDDAKLLEPYSKQITVSPFAIPDESIFKTELSTTFDKLLFVGGESHTPNMLGLMWFLDQIYLPSLDEIKFPLWIVGNWSIEFRNKYKDYSQLVFCGVVNSIEPYFEDSIFVNPILTGAGLRTKVLHAFVNKVPVLSTRFGAEGCYDEQNHQHLGLFDTVDEFMNLLIVSDFKIIGQKGFEYYRTAFDKENLLNTRYNIL